VNRRDFLRGCSAALIASSGLPGCAGESSRAGGDRTRLRDVVFRLRRGRQLFVDDELIADSTLTRVYHQARYLVDRPVLEPDRPWEDAHTEAACAMPYSDGVIFDPRDRVFKAWYFAGLATRNTCLAVSEDGRSWSKPDWGIVRGTNIVWPPDPRHGRDSHTVIRDPHDSVFPYKMQSSASGVRVSPQWLLGSPDGLRWTFLHETPPAGDRTTMFFDPFRRKWMLSLRAGGDGTPRHREYIESDTFVPRDWAPKYWTAADERDGFNPIANGRPPQLYSLDAVAYETVMLGLFTIFRGDMNDRPKLNDLTVGFSRDGLHFHRPDRRPFIGPGEAGSWNYGNIQSVGGCCVVLSDQLLFYVSGRAGVAGTDRHGRCATGLAALRRDGFASLEGTGSITTRPLLFEGRHLFVNAASDGALRCEVLAPDGQVLLPATACAPITGDSTRQAVHFTGVADDILDQLSARATRPLRFRFLLDRARLFAFWLSDTPDGRSGGYLAAGGPEANLEGRDGAVS
jgi:hypothetical protein